MSDQEAVYGSASEVDKPGLTQNDLSDSSTANNKADVDGKVGDTTDSHAIGNTDANDGNSVDDADGLNTEKSTETAGSANAESNEEEEEVVAPVLVAAVDPDSVAESGNEDNEKNDNKKQQLLDTGIDCQGEGKDVEMGDVNNNKDDDDSHIPDSTSNKITTQDADSKNDGDFENETDSKMDIDLGVGGDSEEQDGIDVSNTVSTEIQDVQVKSEPGLTTQSKLDPSLSVSNLQTQAHTIVLPSYSSWFDLSKIHAIERESLPEYFQNSNKAKTPEIYMKYRNFMVNCYRLNPNDYLSYTSVRRNLIGDAGAMLRLHKFLNKWGLINYQVYPETRPKPTELPYTGDFTVDYDTPRGMFPFRVINLQLLSQICQR